MQAIKLQTWIQADGELHLTNLPVKQHNYVEVIILIPDQPTEEDRQAALQRMMERADQMQFRSVSPYPTRDELHERR